MKTSHYAWIALLLIAVSSVNYFHTFIEEMYPSLPLWGVPACSGILILIVFFLIYRNESRLKKLQYEFINIVTHTFRTPTTVVKWSIDGLRKSDHALEIVDDVNQIESANGRMIELLDILIGYTSLVSEEQFTFSAVSFREITENILTKFSLKMREKNIGLTIDIPMDLPFITADAKRLQFVIETILQNAIMYTPPHGTIYVGIHQQGSTLLLAIKDSGMGMERKDRNHLFVQFFRGHEAMTADTQGLGLGLYIAKKIIERHHGNIWATSEGKGKGSQFYVSLPMI